MKTFRALALCLTMPVAAQASLPLSLAPNQNDLGGKTAAPFATANARVQSFYEARELPSASLLVSRLLLRYDGPSAGPTAKTHTIQKLTLLIGVTAKDTSTLGADFADNLTQPLTTVYAQVPFTFQSDALGQSGPEAFGGPGGQFRLDLASPVLLAVPQGGSLAIEIAVEGNSNAGLDPADLDLHVDPTAAQALGSAVTNGRGCPTDLFGGVANLESSGTYQPGTSIVMAGSGYPANTPIFVILTAKTLGMPLAVPGTNPICWLYVDVATGTIEALTVSSASGSFGPGGGGSALPIPKGPGMCGAVLYVQTASSTPVSSGNLLGVETSNYRTVIFGCTAKPQAGGWFVANPHSASARIGTLAHNGAVGVRVE